MEVTDNDESAIQWLEKKVDDLKQQVAASIKLGQVAEAYGIDQQRYVIHLSKKIEEMEQMHIDPTKM